MREMKCFGSPGARTREEQWYEDIGRCQSGLCTSKVPWYPLQSATALRVQHPDRSVTSFYHAPPPLQRPYGSIPMHFVSDRLTLCQMQMQHQHILSLASESKQVIIYNTKNEFIDMNIIHVYINAHIYMYIHLCLQICMAILHIHAYMLTHLLI